MKLTIPKNNLSSALQLAARAAATRSTLPVLANILLTAQNGYLRLSATDLELGITSQTLAHVQESGATTIPARTFADLVKTLPEGEVSLTLKPATETLHIRCGATKADLKGIPAKDFPPVEMQDTGKGLKVEIPTLKEMIQQVVFAASRDEARPVLNGVLLKAKGNRLTLAAADGFRLAVAEMSLAQEAVEDGFQVVVPARALVELARALPTAGEVHLAPLSGKIIFQTENLQVVSQLIDANFPEYEAVIPRTYETRAVLTKAAFLNACSQAAIFATHENNVTRLDFTPSNGVPGQVLVAAQAAETGEQQSELPGSVEGKPLTIAFNVRYLQDALKVIDVPEIALEMTAPNCPGLLRPVGQEGFLHVLMPMHLYN
ncbi:MAG: DNA polymerase III subunit beta [Anaerolineales bacterium]|nr:DNA polymerase III subunit beta [Anaerolineales bacterium]